ncbi:MAG TPA: exo-alpha-sialidase, partial [Roseimicrobium sp.]|nr:exo-alpha-sialidase [Roseimicrobium sp.]
MKSNALHTIWIATLLLSGSVSDNGFAQIPGGFSGIALTDPDAVAAARFAVSKQGTAMNFVGIESVDRQVVAGMNYRLTIKVSENGAARTADAVVWRKLDGSHQLTSWTWIGAKAVTAQPGLVKSEFIYETAPFPSCHASTIVQTARGGLVAAWFGGTAEKNPDVGIWVARLERGRWSAPIEVANGIQYRKADGSVVRHPTWNPVLFQPTTGPLMLFYKAGPNPEEWWGMLTASTDGGKSWEQPRRLPEGILGPIKNKPV